MVEAEPRLLDRGDSRRLGWNALATALLAAVLVQVFHEACHGLLAEACGARFTRFNLFAAGWEGEVSPAQRALIAGGPPVLNVLTGLAAVLLTTRDRTKRYSGLYLFLLYFAAFSLLSGFGYFLKDGAFFAQGGGNAGDMAVVLEYLGGSWLWRGLFILLGAGGWIWTFFWLAGRVQGLTPAVGDKTQRLRVALPLLLTPYLVIGVLFTILAVFHPLGIAAGVIMVGFHYLLGCSGLLWAFFQAVHWREPRADERPTVELPRRLRWGWLAAAALVTVTAVAVLLPTLELG
ncbi:MAG: hypothetical protein GF399_01600 [Candidatus Coatesbacteria bacterium]|nr:hypothetical protein [Candidatus Coatesbacteria bacterium]